MNSIIAYIIAIVSCLKKENKIKRFFLQFLLIGPPIIAFLVGIIYACVVLANFYKDTTSITNAAFVIVSVLATLSFRMATGVPDEKVKDRFLYSGERFFHAAILLILASVLKYAALSIANISFFETRQVLCQIATIPLGILVQACFMYAVMDAHTGIRIANILLWSRLYRSKDWDSVV